MGAVSVWHPTAVDHAAGGVRHYEAGVTRHAAKKGARDWCVTAVVVVAAVAAFAALPLSVWAVQQIRVDHARVAAADAYVAQLRQQVVVGNARLSSLGCPTVDLPAATVVLDGVALKGASEVRGVTSLTSGRYSTGELITKVEVNL